VSMWDRMVGFEDFWNICGLSDIRELEKRYGV